MRWITHIAIASLVVKLLEISLLVDLSGYENWAVLGLYAVMADFDTLLGIKHRTYTHTLYAALAAPLPFAFNDKLFITALAAYLSHLLADMLTVSGIKLFYPLPTTYYFLPAAWRIRTGSYGELAVLMAAILISASFSLAASTTELDKILYYRKGNDIYADISFYENGVMKSFKAKKIVWDDGKSRIGIIVNGRIKIIGKDQISSLKIVKMERVDREERERRIAIKRLKVLDDVITAFNLGYGWREFLGTGEDLFLHLYNGSNENVKIKIRVVDDG